MVFSDYARLRAALTTSADGVGGVQGGTLAARVKECLGMDVDEGQLEWALRYLHAPGDANVNVAALMNTLSVTIAASVSERRQHPRETAVDKGADNL
jgi:hypothetical protein